MKRGKGTKGGGGREGRQRGRGSNNNNNNNSSKSNLPMEQQEEEQQQQQQEQQQTTQGRQNAYPLVIICHSQNTSTNDAAALFVCRSNSRQGGKGTTATWQVMIYHPDVDLWWDRLEKQRRIRLGPPTSKNATGYNNDNAIGCHVLVAYHPETAAAAAAPAGNNELIHAAVLSLGEQVEILTIALLHPPLHAMTEFTTAYLTPTLVIDDDDDDDAFFTRSSSSYVPQRLWQFQDAHSQPRPRLRFDDVEEVVVDWDECLWRWNGPRLRDL
jgi:hypothetical protein